MCTPCVSAHQYSLRVRVVIWKLRHKIDEESNSEDYQDKYDSAKEEVDLRYCLRQPEAQAGKYDSEKKEVGVASGLSGSDKEEVGVALLSDITSSTRSIVRII
ncbi:hypothetical protein J6590_039946 [Homalodisca vitripennis]|nr:hypothetical protein J6590_039946 [Homalodisca vitripennis]